MMMAVTTFSQVSVKGYYRKDGTYVQPHMRSSPDNTPYNNYSYPGNTNPYTGKTATGSEQSYLRKYENYTPTSVNNTANIQSKSVAEGLLGMHRDAVFKMNSEGFQWIKKDVTTDKILGFDIYKLSEDHSIIIYYPKSGICMLVSEINNNNVLEYAIEDLNKRFKKINDSDWISKNNEVLINLIVSEKYFKIGYKKI